MGLGVSGSRALGHALGNLHNEIAGLELSELRHLPRWDTAALFTEASPFRPGLLQESFASDQIELIQQVAELTDEVFADLQAERSPYGVIHSDYILGNCRVRRRAGQWDVGIIDFDDCGRGYHVYDLAAMVGNLADFPNYVRMRDAFLAGYRSVRELNGSAATHLPVLMAARHTVSSLCAAGKAHRNASGASEHIAYRMEQIHRCLALRW